MPYRSNAYARVRQFAALRQIADLGLPSGLFILSFLPSLRKLVKYDNAAFFWLDEDGAVANFIADKMPSCRLDYSDTIDAFLPPIPDVRSYDGRGHRSGATRIADECLRNNFYREILYKNNACYILHAEVPGEKRPLGRLCLMRSAMSEPFRSREASDLSAVSRYISRAVVPNHPARPSAHSYTSGHCFREDLFISDRRGEILYCTDGAQKSLLLSVGLDLVPARLPKCEAESRRFLERLFPADVAAAPASVVRDSIWGRFEFRVERLEALFDTCLGAWAIVMRHLKPNILNLLETVGEVALSPQQWQIARLLAAGKANKEIATALGLSANTVGYHVKQIFTKFDVHDRTSLLAKMTGDYEPSCTGATQGYLGRDPRKFASASATGPAKQCHALPVLRPPAQRAHDAAAGNLAPMPIDHRGTQ